MKNRVTELLDYSADELVGRNLYNLCHAEDADKLKKNHTDRKYIGIAAALKIVHKHWMIQMVSIQFQSINSYKQGPGVDTLLPYDEQKWWLHVATNLCNGRVQFEKCRRTEHHLCELCG